MKLDLPAGLRDVMAALRAAGGRPCLVGGAVRDALLGLPVKDFDVEVFGLPRNGSGGASRRPARRRGAVFPSTRSRARRAAGAVDVSLPRRDSKAGPGHRGIAVTGDPGLTARRGRAPSRLHGERDAARPGDGGDPRPLGRPAGPRGSGAARRGRAHLRRGPAARAARRAVRRALRAARSTRPPRRCARPCRSASCRAERVFGEIEKLLLKARRPSLGLAPAARLGDAGGRRARAAAARDDAAGPGLAPRGRRLGPHTAGRRRGGGAPRRPGRRPAPASSR